MKTQQKWLKQLCFMNDAVSNNRGLLKQYYSRYGGYWRFPELLDYCYLVNPFFPPQKMVEEIKANFDVLLRNYPSGMMVNSQLVSHIYGVEQEFILVGNGAAELIKALMEGYVGFLGNVLPTFEEYPNRLTPDHLIQFTPQSEGFRYSATDLKAFFADKPIDTLLLINPDNPSGNFIPYFDLLDLIQWTKDNDIRFVLDESFVDFVDGDGKSSLLENDILVDNKHLIVIKSISKSFGVPGLRLGILASGDMALVSKLKKNVAIWNINSFGEYYLQIYHKYIKDYGIACTLFKEERAAFFKELSSVPFLKVYPSQANYFLCKVSDRFSSTGLAEQLLSKNILIKDCKNKSAFMGGNYIRLAVRDNKDNKYLVDTLNNL